MSSEDVLLKNDTIATRTGWRDVDVVNDQLRSPSSAFIESSSRWGSDRLW